MTAASLRAQAPYSTDPRYHEEMARVSESRWQYLVAFGLACLAFAAARAIDLGNYGFALSDSLAVVHGHAAAPDQYRYLPHLLMAGLVQALPFRAALEVFIFGFLLTFLCLAMFVAWQERPAIERAACCVFVALIYPLSMFAGARCDTALQLAFMLGGLCLWRRPAAFLTLIAVFSLSRADYALILALFVLLQAYEYGATTSFVHLRLRGWDVCWQPYGAACCIPVAVQIALWLIFPDAAYYTEVIQFGANVTGEVLKIPGFWYTAGAAALVGAYAAPKVRVDRYFVAKLAVLLAYVLMILIVARAREWRLWLPMFPLVYALLFGAAVGEKKRAA